ncbi:hypothetical protein Pdw03_5887 [Penicillium digitatum]|uniref:Uncharacterized protein n=2 Tax=Penicillium digitatum TaxID=36651 RepID=K9GJN5_PEND1|nr:hypothetical protein PDIP_09800 [Penicillium digitatum Pd1]EKV21154.1 hypothetical protein PDIP_09800 [Penicillium digitatum Pd1]QQK48252.1 hypothetical protein Pdw03_5887 [Penicillium digitatum]
MMKFLVACLTLIYVSSGTVNALPSPEDLTVLAYRAWDFRFLGEAPPVCNSSVNNIEFTILHYSGSQRRDCQELNLAEFNSTNVKSISWKSPSDMNRYDLCMFRSPDCSGGEGSLLGNIVSGWDVCYLYNGFKSWTVVPNGEACVPDVGDAVKGEDELRSDLTSGDC